MVKHRGLVSILGDNGLCTFSTAGVAREPLGERGEAAC